MNTSDKTELIEAILLRAAEQIGDITPSAMAAYYRAHPTAKAAFEKHALGRRAQLEGQMIENSLHCLMHWVESPGEIEILLGESIPHHNDTLQIPPDLYSGLIEATADVIAATIPAAHSHELAIWNDVRAELRDVMENCRKFVDTQRAAD